MDRYDVISDKRHLCGETPMWDWETGLFFWSDMLAGELYRYDPAQDSVSLVARGKNVSGFSMRKGGGFVCACHQGVYICDESGSWSLIAEECAGDPLRSNDAIADARGRFLFGTTFYGPDCSQGSYKLGKLYKVERDGGVHILDENVHLANGLGFSPDDRTLYFADTVLRVLYAYDYDLDKGAVSNRRVFAKIPDDEGIPDGLTVDAQGYVWSAQWYGSRVVRYDPDGNVERVVRVPALQVSSVMFGGEELADLYVTTAAKPVKLHVAPKGCDFAAGDTGGPVYRYRFGIQGRAEHKADIILSTGKEGKQ